MKKGLTLIEILVSLGLSSIVFLIVSSLLVTFYTSDTKSKQLEVFERTKNDMTLLLSNSVRWATTVQLVGNDLIVDNNTFSLHTDGRLYKNSDAFTPPTIKVTRFTVEDFTNDPLFPSLQINVEMEDKINSLRKDDLKVVISVRKTSSLIAQ